MQDKFTLLDQLLLEGESLGLTDSVWWIKSYNEPHNGFDKEFEADTVEEYARPSDPVRPGANRPS